MAETLNAPQPCIDFFRTYIVTRLRFWCNHAALKTVAVATLDDEQEHILKAIALGLEMAEAWPVVRDLVVAFAPYMERRGHWEGWHVVLQHAIAAAQRMGDTQSEITLTMLLAKLCQRQSKLEGVVRYYRRVLRLARRTDNRYELARACSNLGFHYIDRGYWWRSEILSHHALVIFEQLDSNHGRAHTHNHLGLLYVRQRLWQAAEQHLQNACTLWQAIGDEHSLIYGFDNLGLLYIEMNRPQAALTYLEKAAQQANALGEEAEMGKISNNISFAYRQCGNLIKAEAYARQAEALFHRYANKLGLAQVWGHLGVIYFQQKKWPEARCYLRDSLETFHILSNHEGMMQARIHLIECEITQNNHTLALCYLDELEDFVIQHPLGRQREIFAERLKELRCRYHATL